MSTTFESRGYEIDLAQLYRAMYDQSVLEDGQRVFHGNSNGVRAVKRLLNDLFGVPVRNTVHPVNNAIRKEAETRMAELGWAEKDAGHSGRYVLYQELTTGVRSFLLTWNPSRGFSWDERAEVVRETSAGRHVDDRWSVGSRTSGVAMGDRIYLMRLGVEPRGLVASGTLTSSEISKEPHWDGTPGKTANYAAVAWDRAVDDSELLPIDDLEQRIPTAKWNPQGGGVLLGEQVADQLEALWWTPPESFHHTDPTERRQAREAGYLADAAVRSAIEKHAEGIAERFYDGLDYGVDLVGTFRSYDLHLVHRQTGEERHVEVKGSSGGAETVELTVGEVRHAREFHPTDLFIVSGIAWRRDGLEVDTSGGNVTRHADWMPANAALKPVRYRYQVPPDGIEV